jgi:hypothetical protein
VTESLDFSAEGADNKAHSPVTFLTNSIPLKQGSNVLLKTTTKKLRFA